MLILSDMKCDACKKEFRYTAQGSQYYCNQCNKPFTLCPSCKDNWTCDYCGSNDFRDIYEEFRRKNGTDIFF